MPAMPSVLPEAELVPPSVAPLLATPITSSCQDHHRAFFCIGEPPERARVNFGAHLKMVGGDYLVGSEESVCFG